MTKDIRNQSETEEAKAYAGACAKSGTAVLLFAFFAFFTFQQSADFAIYSDAQAVAELGRQIQGDIETLLEDTCWPSPSLDRAAATIESIYLTACLNDGMTRILTLDERQTEGAVTASITIGIESEPVTEV